VGHSHLKRSADGTLVGLDGEDASNSDNDQEDDPAYRMLAPPDKRLRLLAAGLSRRDRARIKNVPKAMSHSRISTSGATSSLGWAGAGADMLEKKRKEEERRRTIDEKKRVKEVYTQIGAKDWKSEFLQSTSQVASVHERLSLRELQSLYIRTTPCLLCPDVYSAIQQEIARAQAAPLCVESKQLPDLESMRDVMTLHAVEAGLPRGAQLQAAALLLAAVQVCFRSRCESLRIVAELKAIWL
jgi:transcriptional coactivator HFI1/ADA1